MPIPGSRQPDRLRENAGSAEVMLTAGEMSEIDSALGKMKLEVYSGVLEMDEK